MYIKILTWIEPISARWDVGCRMWGVVNAIANRY